MPRNTRARKLWCKEDGHLSEPPAHWALLLHCCAVESSGWRKESCAWHSKQEGLPTQMLPCGRDCDTRQDFWVPSADTAPLGCCVPCTKGQTTHKQNKLLQDISCRCLCPWKSENSPETRLAFRSTSASVTQAFITSRSSPPLFRDQKLHKNSQ